MDSSYFYAVNNTALNEEAQERALQFQLGYYAHPIFHPNGNYPQVMIDRIASRSAAEGFSHSRMPSFTSEEINMIRGTADYFGLNHYTSYNAIYIDDYGVGDPNFYLDQGIITETVESSIHGQNGWTVSNYNLACVVFFETFGFKFVPDGLRLLLQWIKEEYNNPEIVVTENGFADDGRIDDTERTLYYQYYLNAVLEATLEDNVNVTGYTAWSLMDNFEWLSGYVYVWLQKF